MGSRRMQHSSYLAILSDRLRSYRWRNDHPLRRVLMDHRRRSIQRGRVILFRSAFLHLTRSTRRGPLQS